MRKSATCSVILLMTPLLPPSLALAAEVQNFSYDARGRLASVCRATPYSAQHTIYHLDAAENRKNYRSASTVLALQPSAAILSTDGRFKLAFQTDGNLAVYGNLGSGWVPLGWSSGTAGSGTNLLSLQSDGNLVLSGPAGAIWDSITWGNYCATLAVLDDQVWSENR